MELYDRVAFKHSQDLTLAYSTSFGKSSALFAPSIRKYIYAIYGLVRIADEIVDTYAGADSAKILADLRLETYAAIKRQYSSNPIVHAFAVTATKFSIEKELIDPFFDSMAMDLKRMRYDQESYVRYIRGSAEVVGLMCCKVFCAGDQELYDRLKVGAEALGAAYQKINFLRDLAADYSGLGRWYFPGTNYDQFDQTAKSLIESDIDHDLTVAEPTLIQLPKSARSAVTMSYLYYNELLNQIKKTPVNQLKSKRVRVSDWRKARLYFGARLRRQV